MACMTSPWAQFPKSREWDTAAEPYVVTWAVWVGDRLTRWLHETRTFATEAEARAAYNLPYRFGRSIGKFERPGYAPLIARMTDGQARKHCAKHAA